MRSVSTNAAVQRQTAVAAYLKSKQLLLFIFALHSVCLYIVGRIGIHCDDKRAYTAF